MTWINNDQFGVALPSPPQHTKILQYPETIWVSDGFLKRGFFLQVDPAQWESCSWACCHWQHPPAGRRLVTRMHLDLKLAQASLFVICSTRNRSYNHTYIHEYNKYSSYSSIYSFWYLLGIYYYVYLIPHGTWYPWRGLSSECRYCTA